MEVEVLIRCVCLQNELPVFRAMNQLGKNASGINSSKKAPMSKSQLKTMLIIFFNIQGIVCFEFITQGRTVNQAYYVEILKWLCETVHRKRSGLIATMTML
jgi:hypothetical protein